MKLARLHEQADKEPYWHVHLAIFIAIALQIVVSSKLTVGPKALIAGFEVLLVIALTLASGQGHKTYQKLRRSVAFGLIGLISAFNIVSLVLVIRQLFTGHNVTGTQLILSALAIYLTNIIIFGIWYWELDTNITVDGAVPDMELDFLFPQMTVMSDIPIMRHWTPTFLDYLYVSITNASAFSPTDTMPLSHRAKSLMTLQSAISLITIALVAARAVNILS
jgi:hypothetical protein